LFYSDFFFCLHFAQLQGLGWTRLNAGWQFFAEVCFVKAQVTLLHLPIGSELRRTESARFQTSLASDASITVHSDDPVFRPFRYRLHGTGFHTRRIGTVHA
jgi:hypothetical protein